MEVSTTFSWNLVGTDMHGMAAASVLWLPYQALTFLVRSGGAPQPDSPLGDAARLLALVLLHHTPPADSGLSNPFRQALQQLQVWPLLLRRPIMEQSRQGCHTLCNPGSFHAYNPIKSLSWLRCMP